MLQQYSKYHQLGRRKECVGKHSKHRACALFIVSALEIWECGIFYSFPTEFIVLNFYVQIKLAWFINFDNCFEFY